MRPTDGDGFSTADVSVDLLDDDRVRKLARKVPVERLESAMVVFLAVLLASWRKGRRVSADEAFPLWLPADRLVDATADLRSVGLLDRSARIRVKSWSKWYDPVVKRRDRNRERWTRYNASRTGATAELPRGSDVATAPSVPLRSAPLRSSPSRARETRSQATEEAMTSLADAIAGTPFAEEVARRRGG